MRNAIVRQCRIISLQGLPVVLVVAFFSGGVLALQVGREVQRFGLENNIGQMVSIAMVREMGPVMTGVILAGLFGSKLASELGTMKVSEEIDALESMSISPVKFLVLPRFLAMVACIPILTVYADLVGIVGGGLVSQGILDVSFPVYFREARLSLTMSDVYVGLLKSIIFGIIIAVVACYQGLQAVHGARGVGRVTVRSVVVCMLFIIIFNYIIGWIFF